MKKKNPQKPKITGQIQNKISTTLSKGGHVNTTILDNEDYMIALWVDDPAVLKSLESKGIFSRSFPLNQNLWLVRVDMTKYNDMKTELNQAKFKMVVTRYTSGSAYRSSDPADQASGSNITGV
jgi:hypothetical protein